MALAHLHAPYVDQFYKNDLLCRLLENIDCTCPRFTKMNATMLCQYLNITDITKRMNCTVQSTDYSMSWKRIILLTIKIQK